MDKELKTLMPVDLRGSYSLRGRWYKKHTLVSDICSARLALVLCEHRRGSNHPLSVEAVENTGSASLAMSV